MQDIQHPLWTRGLLGLVALVILVFTLPAYMNPANNPALAQLSPETGSLGSIAGAFLARQLGIALIGVYGVVKGTTQPMLIGAFGLAFFNLHDAVFLTLFGSGGPGAIAGLVLGGAALAVMLVVSRKAKVQA